MSRVCMALMVLGIVCFFQDVQAGVIQNGDFSSGLSNWTTDAGFVPPTDGGGFALFAETLDGVQLAQSFTLPGNALSLSFDFQINATGSLIPGAVPNNFQATLFTSSFDSLFPSDPSSPILFPAFYSIDNSGLAPEYFDNNFVAVQSLVSGYKRVTLDLTSILATYGNQTLTIDFLLNESLDGISTTVMLDNVVLNVQAVSVVPEPVSAAVWLTMLGSVMLFQRRKATGVPCSRLTPCCLSLMLIAKSKLKKH